MQREVIVGGVLFVGSLVGITLLGGTVLAAVALARRPAPSPSQAADAARRHAAVVHGVALAMLFASMVAGNALVAGLPLSRVQGLYLGLIPAAAGLAFAAVQAVGELTWPRPTGTVRRAPLTRRTVADVAPTWLRRVTWGWAALTAVTLVICGLASDDGRRLSRTFAGGGASAGPFPGWFYGVPLLAAVALVLLASEGVLRLIAHRPAVMDAAPEWDRGLRRTSSRRLLRGTQLVLGWTASGVLLIAGLSVRSLGAGGSANGISTGSTPYALAGSGLLLLGVAVLLASVVAMFAPARLPAPDGAPEPGARTVPA